MEKKRKIRCDCGGTFSEQYIDFDKMRIKALVCNKCRRKTLTKEQALEYARLKEIHSLVNGKRKIIKIGNSIGITLPEKLGLKPGKKVKTEVIDSKSFRVVFG